VSSGGAHIHHSFWGIFSLLGVGYAWLLEFSDEPLARYGVVYEPDRRHLKEVTPRQLFDSQYHSPQLALWNLADGEWLKALRVHPRAPQAQEKCGVIQLEHALS
jgi:hypothetical protein